MTIQEINDRIDRLEQASFPLNWSNSRERELADKIDNEIRELIVKRRELQNGTVDD